MFRKKAFFRSRSSFKVLVQFIRMLQVVADHLIHIGEPQTIVLLANLFGCRATVKCPDDDIERHPSAADAVHSQSVFGQWNFVNSGHIQTVAHRRYGGKA
jgi:hypothetical protein